MNLAEFGYIIAKSLNANWDDHDHTDFIWNLSKMLDEKVDDIELEDHWVRVDYMRKSDHAPKEGKSLT